MNLIGIYSTKCGRFSLLDRTWQGRLLVTALNSIKTNWPLHQNSTLANPAKPAVLQ